MSKTTMLEADRAASACTSSSLIAGWLMLVNRESASVSAKTIAANAARSIDPSAATTCGPNASPTARSARPPGASTRRPSSSTSMTCAPRSANRWATVLLPDPMPPVSPTISTGDSVLPGAPIEAGTAPRSLARRDEVADQAGQHDRTITLHGVASPLDPLDAGGRQQLPQLRLVIVMDEERLGAPHQHQRGLHRGHVGPESIEVHRGGTLTVQPVVAPRPSAVVQALRVVEHARAEGLDGPAGHRRGRGLQHLLEGVVDRRAGHERDRPPLLVGHRLGSAAGGRQGVDDDGPADQVGPV